jgi:hypothetical protein
MYVYAYVAYESGIIDKWEQEALKKLCEEEVAALRKANKLELKNNSLVAFNVIITIGGFVPFIGLPFDVLDQSITSYAATIDMLAIEKISNPSNLDIITHALARNTKYNFKYTVYEMFDEAGVVRYVGRTRQSIKARQKQHWKADINKKGLGIQVAKFEGELLENVTHAQARGLEHLVFESHGGFRNKKLLNKIRPLDLNNPKVAKKASSYIDEAWDFLKKIIN